MIPDQVYKNAGLSAPVKRTADRAQIKLGMTVYVWDDLPAVPRLDQYRVTAINDDNVSLIGMARLNKALCDQCWLDRKTAILDGFRECVVSLDEHGDTLGRPRRVGKRGVRVDLDGRTLWIGRQSFDLGKRIGGKFLLGRVRWHEHLGDAWGDQLIAYELDGTYINVVADLTGGAS